MAVGNQPGDILCRGGGFLILGENINKNSQHVQNNVTIKEVVHLRKDDFKMQTQNIQPLAFGTEDACRALGIKRSTFFKLLKSGEIRPIRIGAKLLVTQTEIARIIAAAEQAAAERAA